MTTTPRGRPTSAPIRFGARTPVGRPAPAVRSDAGPGLNAWVTCGVTLTPATTGQMSAHIPFSVGGGGSIVGWSDMRNGRMSCFASRLDGNGDHVGGWTAGGNAVSVSDSSQILVGAATDNAGGGLFLYANVDPQIDNAHDLYLQRLTGAGTAAGGFPAGGKRLIEGAVGTGGMFSDGSGGLFFGWSQPSGTNLKVTRLDATGAATGGWPVGGIDTGIPDQADGEAAVDGVGGLYFVFVTSNTVNVQRYTSTGVLGGWPAGGVVVFSSVTPFSSGVEVGITRLSNGDALVAWVNPSTNRVFAQRVNAAGTVDAGWPATGRQLTTSTDPQQQPQVVADGAGGALIAWAETVLPFPFGKVFVQRVTSAGAISGGWPATGVALLTSDTAFEPSNLVSDGANGAIAAWTDLRSGNDADIYAQRVAATGAVAAGWPADGVAICASGGDTPFPLLATDGAGGAIVTYQN